MITKSQQQIIDSITSEFERINSTESMPLSQLARKIKGEIEGFNREQDEFKTQTEYYEKANQLIFDDFCKQVEDLCNELGLIFRYDNGEREGLVTLTRSIKVIFPQFGSIQKLWYVRPMVTNSFGLKGLDSASLYLKDTIDSNFYSFNELPKAINTIAKKIVQTHKEYSK